MKYDCVVCGGGPSGMTAAIKARRLGLNVLIVENSPLLGGTNILSLVSPLMTFHNNKTRVVGGIAQEIVDKLIERKGSLGHISDPLGFCATVTPVDVEALKNLYFEILQDEGINLLLHTRIIGVTRDNNRITAIKVANKNGISEIEGNLFIDATGDGDVACFAGLDFIVGRKCDNLCQPMTMPFIIGNVDMNQLKTAMKENRSNFVLSDDYDFDYVGISGFFKEVELAKKNNDFDLCRDRVLLFADVHKNQVIVNMTRVLKHNPLDTYELTLSEIEGRNQIQKAYNFLKKYIKGFENSYIVNTPYQIGVRESRHISTEYVITKEDVLTNKKFEDSIAVCAFPMDIHSPTGSSLEVELDVNNLTFEIPLRVLYSKRCDNLIVTGRAVGATHEAAASLRVTPVVMALGEAAGVLAYIASKNNFNVNSVNFTDVQQKLTAGGQIIHNENN